MAVILVTLDQAVVVVSAVVFVVVVVVLEGKLTSGRVCLEY